MPLGSGYYAIVIAIDLVATVPAVAIVIGPTYRSIDPAMVVTIRPVKGVTHGAVIPAVRIIVHQAEVQRRAGEIGMPWAVHIVPVIYVDISCVIVKDAIWPVVDKKSTNPTYATVAITDTHIADLVYTAVEIIIDGNLLHLDHGAVIVILYIGVVIESGIEGNTHTAEIDMSAYLVHAIDKEIKFAIRVNRKGNSTLCEDERLPISISIIRSEINRTSLCQSD